MLQVMFPFCIGQVVRRRKDGAVGFIYELSVDVHGQYWAVFRQVPEKGMPFESRHWCADFQAINDPVAAED